MIRCKVCQSKDIEIIKVNSKSYYFCNNCEFASLDEKNQITEKQEKDRYLLHRNNINDQKYVQMLKEFLDYVISAEEENKTAKPTTKQTKNETARQTNNRTTKPKSALDFGCGHTPVLGEIMKRKGIKTDLFDKIFYPDQTVLEKEYDLVCATEVIEHVKDPNKLFEMLAKLISKNGKIGIMTLLNPVKEKFRTWWYVTDETHTSFYSIKSIKILAEKYGLKIIKTDEKRRIVMRRKD